MGNGMLSQEEIDALLHGTAELDTETQASASETAIEDPFTDMEKDALGEIANISMGTAATTLSQLLGKKVDITTPRVDVTTSEQIRKDYPVPSVIVNVQYKLGLEGSNLLILSQKDGAVIVDLMMGGDGKNPAPELTEIHLSGIGEAMNQMMGSAATSMSTMFNSVVDITPPSLVLNDLSTGPDLIKDFLNMNQPLVRISFRMVVGDVIDSILVQVIPVDVAKGMVEKLMKNMSGQSSTAATAQLESPSYDNTAIGGGNTTMSGSNAGVGGYIPTGSPAGAGSMPGGYQQSPAFNQSYNPAGQYAASQQSSHSPYHQPVTPVQPAQFAPLQPAPQYGNVDNLGLILDVPLQVSVELGKAKKTIKEILELGPGSVIELERLAGEPVDMIVNGKLIAKCEVVVINETFGIRITEIIQPAERLKNLN